MGSESEVQRLLRLPLLMEMLLRHLRGANAHIHSNRKLANECTDIKTKPKPTSRLLMKTERCQSEDESYVKFWSCKQ